MIFVKIIDLTRQIGFGELPVKAAGRNRTTVNSTLSESSRITRMCPFYKLFSTAHERFIYSTVGYIGLHTSQYIPYVRGLYVLHRFWRLRDFRTLLSLKSAGPIHVFTLYFLSDFGFGLDQIIFAN